MQYQVIAAPVADRAQQQDELGRLLRFAKRLTMTFVVVSAPYRQRPQTVCLLDVPDRFTEPIERVLAILTGRDDAAVPTNQQVKARAEWTETAQLRALADAQALDGRLLAGVSSANLTVQYTPRGATATLRYSEQDRAILDRAKALGWEVRERPSGLAGLFSASGGAPVMPMLGWPESRPAAPLAETPVSVELASIPERQAAPGARGLSPILAAPGAPGLFLGTALDGTAAQLTWESHVISLVAPPDRTRMALLALTSRAFQSGMSLVIIAGRNVLRDQALAPYMSRIRMLDSLDLWQSAAIPWREIAPDALTWVLSRAGITGPIPAPLPEYFGELLAQIGGKRLATQPLLGLTAPPGDDLRGVVAAGGGIALVDDGDAGGALLADLLMACLASPPLERPILLLRQPGMHVPASLAEQAMQIVLGHEAAVAATLTSIPPTEGWRLTFSDGSAPVDLLADLTSTPLSADANYHGRIIAGLSGSGSAVALDDGEGALDAWYEGAPLERRAADTDEVAEQPVWDSLANAALAGDDAPADRKQVSVLEVPAAGVVAPSIAEAEPVAFDGEDWDALAVTALGAVDTAQAPADGEPAPDTAFDVAEQDEQEWDVPGEPEPGAPALAAPVDLGEDAGAHDWAQIAEPEHAPVADAPNGDLSLPDALLPDASTDADTGDGLQSVAAFDVDLLGDDPDDLTDMRPGFRPRLGRRRRRSFMMRRLAAPYPDALEDAATVALPETGAELAPPPADLWGAGDVVGASPEFAPAEVESAAPPASMESEPASAEWAIDAVRVPLPGVGSVEVDSFAAPPRDAEPAPVSAAWLAPTDASPADVEYQEALDAAELITAFHAGVSVAELVRRMYEADPATSRDAHRARLRALLAISPPMSPTSLSALAPMPRPLAAPVVPMPPATVADAPAAALDDESIWSDWLADVPLETMLKARCGYERGVAANRVRDRIYRVVIPRIVAELETEELVARLCEGRKPLKAQVELYETLLRRVVRQSRPVTGALREAIHERIVLVMRYVTPQHAEV
jgi:hypothetical protein